MKKKCVLMLMSIALVGLISGCGQKEVTKAASVSATGAMVEEISSEVKNIAKEAPDSEKKKEHIDVAAEFEPADESFVVNDDIDPEFSVDAIDEFPAISPTAMLKDKSDEYGVYSISSYDIQEFLDEDGVLIDGDDADNLIYSEYSGRWAYPKLVWCDLLQDAEVIDRTDSDEYILSHSENHDCNISTFIYGGLSLYNSSLHNAIYDGIDGIDLWRENVEYVDGYTDIIHVLSSGAITDEAGDTVELVSHSYIFKIADFSVMVIAGRDELSESEVFELVDSIRPTNGMER